MHSLSFASMLPLLPPHQVCGRWADAHIRLAIYISHAQAIKRNQHQQQQQQHGRGGSIRQSTHVIRPRVSRPAPTSLRPTRPRGNVDRWLSAGSSDSGAPRARVAPPSGGGSSGTVASSNGSTPLTGGVVVDPVPPAHLHQNPATTEHPFWNYLLNGIGLYFGSHPTDSEQTAGPRQTTSELDALLARSGAAAPQLGQMAGAPGFGAFPMPPSFIPHKRNSAAVAAHPFPGVPPNLLRPPVPPLPGGGGVKQHSSPHTNHHLPPQSTHHPTSIFSGSLRNGFEHHPLISRHQPFAPGGVGPRVVPPTIPALPDSGGGVNNILGHNHHASRRFPSLPARMPFRSPSSGVLGGGGGSGLMLNGFPSATTAAGASNPAGALSSLLANGSGPSARSNLPTAAAAHLAPILPW